MTDQTPDRKIQQEVLEEEKARWIKVPHDELLDECPPWEGPLRYQVEHNGVELIVQMGLIEQEDDYVVANLVVYDPKWRGGRPSLGAIDRDPGVIASWKVFEDGRVEEAKPPEEG